MERAAQLLAATLLCGALARGGIVGGSQADLADAGFELGLSAWTQAASDASSPFLLAAAPGRSGQAAYCDLPPGVTASLALSSAPGEVHGASAGVKLEARGGVWLSAGAGPGELRLEMQGFDGVGWTSLGLSAILDVEQAPRETWLRLCTLPDASTDARVPQFCTELRFVFHCSAPGGVYFDELEVGRFEYAEYELQGASFEGSAWPAWQADGPLEVHDGSTQADGYYGRQHLTLEPWTATRVWQSLPAGGVEGSAVPDIGRELEACAWFRLSPSMLLLLSPDPELFVEVAVHGVEADGAEVLLARGRWHPTIEQRERWHFLQTEPLAALAPSHRALRLELRSTLPGAVDVDFAQLGERHGVDGNPRRRVGANYVGRYRSPHFPGATTTPASAQERWRNWRWVAPNACDNSFTGFYHDPDCTTSAACFRENGRRDLAVTTLRGEDELPLVGAYDSRDPDVVRYHVELAQAAGIDHFIYDWLGHELALQNLVQGREPLNQETFDVLLDVAEESGRDFKVAVMYEPKVHYLGWVAGEPTNEAKIAGITGDLTWLAEQQRDRRSAMRRDGRLVVFVFRDTVCSPDGSQCLDAQAWSTIAQAVEAATGESLFLIGDVAQAAGSPMSGVSRWRLVAPELLEYRTYQDVEQQAPTLPAPELVQLEQHARNVHAVGTEWAAQDDAERVSIPVVWPGFDDSGVGGWGSTNLAGEDGSGICVRVTHDFRGAFYPTVVASALDSGSDWIQIATWNDWNEGTHLEPAWLEGYYGTPFGSSAAPAKVRRHVYGRLLATQAWIASFKGVTLSPALIPRVARDYLLRAATAPGVTQYD